jgi:penicillin amidase
MIAGALLVLLLVAACASGCVVWSIRRYPLTSGTVSAKGIDGQLEILRGPYGVPHVLATTPRDAYFGLGFCEAQDRTFQLEVFRRAANGTLAEILGEGGIKLDRFNRTIGIQKVAEKQMANSAPEARVLAQAFVDGINAGLRSLRSKPPELHVLGIEPGEWSVTDTIALARIVSYGLAKDHVTSELIDSRIAARLGEEKARELLPPVIKATRGDRACAAPLLEGGDELDRLGIGAGCSNWIIGGSRTKNGKPLFAYDSHQTGARMPGEVYLAHLVGGPDLDVMGGVIVGVPGYYSGATRETAFAPTNVGADACDLVAIETSGESYTACGKTLPFTKRTETIVVKGRSEPEKLEVRETVLGPVVSSVLVDDAPLPRGGTELVLDWAGLRPELRLDGYVTMPLAKDWTSFRRCLGAFEAAAQHYGFACSDGTIAYQVIGPLPKREEGPPPWPAPPATLDPRPLLSLDDLPHLVNPGDDFVATANQRPIHSDEPFYMGRNFIPNARHDRLVELCDSKGNDMASLEQQGLDLVSPHARRVAPMFAAILHDAKAADARWVGEKLGAWDASMKGDAVEPLLYHAVVAQFASLVLAPLGTDLARDYASRPELAQERLAAILADPQSPFFPEGREALVEKATLAALALIESRLGKDRSGWRWDALHTVELQSYLHDATTLLDAGPFGVPGDDDTPYRFGHKTLHEPFKAETIALVRMFVDLGDPSFVDAIVSSGEQGWPWHPHSRDQLPIWLEGKTIRIPRDVSVIRATCPERLVIEAVK